MPQNIANAIVKHNSNCSIEEQSSSCYCAFMDISRTRRLRLMALKDKYGGQADLAKALGTTPSYVYQMLTGRRPISEKNARKYEKVLSLPIHWFDTGLDVNNVSPGPDITRLVPLISWVKAGCWHEAFDPFEPGEAEEYLHCPSSHSPMTFALRVEGDSMTAPHGKSYPSGCIIFVDPDQRGGVTSGERVIAKLSGRDAVTFKIYVEDSGNKFLRPLNPQYPPITDEFRILGKVIGKWEPE